MDFSFLTLFPDLFSSFFEASLLGKARKKGLITSRLVQIRDFAQDKHRRVDGAPFGGSEGMLLRADVLASAWRSVQTPRVEKQVTVLLSPQGVLFSQAMAKSLASNERVIFVCSRYEGVDERFIQKYVDWEVSLGDYILTGGELPAMVMADTIARLIPAVVSNPDSLSEESLEGGTLKYPQYTRPRVFEGAKVPEVLLQGDHAALDQWRHQERLKRTWVRRPGLFLEKPPISMYVVLLHTHVVNRRGEAVTTSVTNMDIHDIARSARTYGACGYFLVTPIEDQAALVGRILAHWGSQEARDYHPDRVEAVSLVRMVRSFEEVKQEIRLRHGQDPEVVLTDARRLETSVSYEAYRQELLDPARSERPVILVFGTGWGVSDSFYPEVDRILEPIYGPEGSTGYNHLSVRAAVAVVLDRLLGQ